ncbi:Uncharacterised protein [Bordetella ansorpii]|uniref:DNA mimic protein DMP19 C-terminal domain-containing protein n=1 Tax=Bordetella ansorpii TaxID=288768 RepID=A0A157RMF1_9BORD|nr:DUF4375 domain-containing protein [Bordetella ansorpii]SAI59171.1 Uncharacterised protein [Bordetella ansorpii]
MTSPASEILSPRDAILVSRNAFDSEDTYDIIESNIAFLNALFEAHLMTHEVSRAALTSYYVDYYYAQLENGGFSQFVFNSRWSDEVVDMVREGLQGMGAAGHLALFDAGAAVIAELGGEAFAAYLSGQYFGEDEVRDRLDEVGTPSYELSQQEDLIALNAVWLRQHPDLRALPLDELQQELDRRAAAVPDRQAREQAAKESEPLYIKQIRALCEQAGQTLERVTAGDINTVYDGKQLRDREDDEPVGPIVWFFITDAGLHCMAQGESNVVMFNAQTRKQVAELDVSG